MFSLPTGLTGPDTPARMHRPGSMEGWHPSKKAAHRAPCARRFWIATGRAGSDELRAAFVKDTCPGGPNGDRSRFRAVGERSPTFRCEDR